MLTAGAIVAAVVVPVGVAAWLLARRRAKSLMPPWKPWRVPWGGFEVFFAFLVLQGVVPLLLVGGGVEPLAAGVIALPIQLVLLAAAWLALYPRWNPLRDTRIAGEVALAVIAWVVLTPLVLAFYFAVLQVFAVLEWQPDEHPLTQFSDLTPLRQVLFILQACVAAPLIEEILFRGLLLPWLIGGRERQAGGNPLFLIRQAATPGLVGGNATGVATPVALRPWLVMGFVVGFAVTGTRTDPIVFAGVLVAGLVVIGLAMRWGKRHFRGVYASAALFAMVHCSVWPSPLPLFLLGLGLGWLAVRTRGVLVPFLVHGLFNAVSAVFVLRGAG